MIQNLIVRNSNTKVFNANMQTTITSIFFTNISDELESVTVYAVKSGESITSKQIILNELPLVGKDTYVFNTEKLILDKNDSIWVKCLTGSVVTTVSGIELKG